MRLLLSLVLIGLGCWLLADALATSGEQLGQAMFGGAMIGFGISVPLLLR